MMRFLDIFVSSDVPCICLSVYSIKKDTLRINSDFGGYLISKTYLFDELMNQQALKLHDCLAVVFPLAECAQVPYDLAVPSEKRDSFDG